MSTEEKKNVEILMAASATTAEHKAAIKWIGEYLEEGYILNLRPSAETLGALLAFSKSTKVEPALKKRAGNLHKKYKLKR